MRVETSPLPLLCHRTLPAHSRACWGVHGSGGESDGGDNGTPVAVPTLTGVIEVGVGDTATCALHDDGTVSCWGSTALGVTGVVPDAGLFQPTPHLVSGVSNAIHVVVGSDNFGCALKRDGSVVCWGENFFGQLGRGVDKTTTPFDPTAAPVAL